MGKKYLDTKEGSLEQSILGLWQEAAKNVNETNKNDKSDDGDGLETMLQSFDEGAVCDVILRPFAVYEVHPARPRYPTAQHTKPPAERAVRCYSRLRRPGQQ